MWIRYDSYDLKDSFRIRIYDEFLGDPDVTDWKKNTNYKSGYGPTHQVRCLTLSVDDFINIFRSFYGSGKQ